MLLESVSSAAKRAEELYNNINENKISVETLNRVEEHFTGMCENSVNRKYYRIIISIYMYVCIYIITGMLLDLYELILSEVTNCSSKFKVH